MKLCTVCKLTKPFSDFNRKKANKDGLQPHCRNCSHRLFKEYYHTNREKHYIKVKKNQIEYEKRNREYLLKIKLERGCYFCPESEPCCLDFHHIKDKKFDLGAVNGHSLDTVKEEVNKCIVVCSNCHRKLHAGRLMPPTQNWR